MQPMKHTLLMRLKGPMQSWGVGSRFALRETLTEPSRSGVTGLLCAALGWDRAAETHLIAGQERRLADLTALPLGIRVLQEGVVKRDYHTAQQVLRAKVKLRPGKSVSSTDLQETVLSERYYLSDADFLVGLESEEPALLEALDAALADPHWPLCLGRKAYGPSRPLHAGQLGESSIYAMPLTEALFSFEAADLQKPDNVQRPPGRCILSQPDAFLESQGYQLSHQQQLTDLPLSFGSRQSAPRQAYFYQPPQP